MADKVLELEVMCPDRTFYHGNVTMVEFNTTEGYIGVYPEHIPLATVLASGIMTIHEENGDIKQAAVHEGFAKITQDKVMILAEIAEWPDEIDLNRAEEAKIRAERRLDGQESGMDIQRAEVALKKSLTRISLKN
ncbi:MAG: ATP synthase F1 subunit epsilon [Butyrivibrio sp.]